MGNVFAWFPSDPQNGRVRQNVEKYEKLLGSLPSQDADGLRRPTSKHIRTRDTYERLCQTQGSQVNNQNPYLSSVLSLLYEYVCAI